MKFVVLGATGACGKHVVRQALDAGHQVVAYVRRPEAVEPRAGLEIIGGSLDDVSAMAAAFTGADAVISCLGVKLSFASMRHANLMEAVLPKIVRAIETSRAKRFVLTSAFGVGDTASKASGLARFFGGTLLGAIFGDKARSERGLANSAVNWTTLYPVVLFDGPRAASVQVTPIEKVTKVQGLPKIPYDNLASVLIEAATGADLGGKRLLVTA